MAELENKIDIIYATVVLIFCFCYTYENSQKTDDGYVIPVMYLYLLYKYGSTLIWVLNINPRNSKFLWVEIWPWIIIIINYKT